MKTSKLHYVKVPEDHIVIDFDIPGPDGKKSYERNIEAASKWPKTYAALSKLKKASPTIMIVGAAIGGVTAAVLACKATLKAEEIIAEHKNYGIPFYLINLGNAAPDVIERRKIDKRVDTLEIY